MFAVDQFSIGFDIKDSTGALNEFYVETFFAFNDGRQTGGLRCIVSDHTIRDFDLHLCGSFGFHCAVECVVVFLTASLKSIPLVLENQSPVPSAWSIGFRTASVE